MTQEFILLSHFFCLLEHLNAWKIRYKVKNYGKNKTI